MPRLDLGNPIANCDINTSSLYYETEEFRDQFGDDLGSLKFFHVNVRSVSRNLDELLLFLELLHVEFHVLVITETWLNKSGEFPEIAGYKSCHSIRENRIGGGVSVLVKNDLHAEIMPDYTLISNIFEMCTVQIVVNKTKFVISGIYRPPDALVADFNHVFFELITNDLFLNSMTVIMGDFNINVGSAYLTGSIESFISEFNSLYFFQRITLPTRVQGNSSTIIDHIWINSLLSCQSGVFPTHIM